MALVLEPAGETKNKQQQLQKQVTELQDLKLEDIAPLWAKTLREKKQPSLPLDMGDYGCCIVGEAHGFSDLYILKGHPRHCDACTRYAAALGMFAGKPHKKTDSIYFVTRGFMAHFNQVHKEWFYDKYTGRN